MKLEIRQKLARIFYPRGAVRRVLRGPVQGLRYVVRPGMGATYALGTDAMNFRFLAGKLRTGMTVYDIGANRGQFALFSAKQVGPGGKVFSFEPVPSVFADLERNLSLNDLSHVEAVRAAVCDEDGAAAFSFEEERSTQGKLPHVEPAYRIEGDTFEVDALSLDRFLSNGAPAPDVMKVDVEGAAASVFAGASSLLENAAPRIYVELHGPEEQARVRDELLARGYVAETLDGQRVEDPTSAWFSPLWCYRP